MLPWITRGLWAGAVAKGLLCEEQGSGTGVDAIVVENFDVNYLVFERASELKRKGLTARVLVPVQAAPDTGEPDLVFGQIAEMMGADRSNRGTDDDPRPRGGADLVEHRLPGA